ncbi:MAG: hypothetical protein JNG85_16665, partial [Spirochaetaceae bacterium]|nr:hypothetical protein [Spirochaetaceae bacterium]
AAATPSAGATVTLTWTNPGDADFRRVRISWTGPTTGSYTCADDAATYTTGSLSIGTYTFAIKSEDDAGNIQTTGVSRTATTDSTPPVDVSGAAATANAGGTVTLAWTNPTDADFRRVRISWTGTATGSYTCADDATSYTTGALADGAYTFAIKSEDDAGNIQTTGVTRTATADSTPPGDVGGAAATANAGGTVTLAWTNPTTSDFRRVRISWTGTATGSYTCADDATTYTTGVLADGAYTFAIKSEDDLGNIQPTGVTRTATADSTPPGSVTSFTAVPDSGNKVDLAWVNPGDGDFRRVRISWSGQESGSLIAADGATTATTGNLSAGSYTFEAKTEDATGNVQGTGESAGPIARAIAGTSYGPAKVFARLTIVIPSASRSAENDGHFLDLAVAELRQDRQIPTSGSAAGTVKPPVASSRRVATGTMHSSGPKAISEQVVYSSTVSPYEPPSTDRLGSGSFAEEAVEVGAAPRGEDLIRELSEAISSEAFQSASPRRLHSETLIHQAGFAPSSSSGAPTASPPPSAPQPAAPDGGLPPLPSSAPRYALAPAPTGLEAKRRLGARFARLAAEK